LALSCNTGVVTISMCDLVRITHKRKENLYRDLAVMEALGILHVCHGDPDPNDVRRKPLKITLTHRMENYIYAPKT